MKEPVRPTDGSGTLVLQAAVQADVPRRPVGPLTSGVCADVWTTGASSAAAAAVCCLYSSARDPSNQSD